MEVEGEGLEDEENSRCASVRVEKNLQCDQDFEQAVASEVEENKLHQFEGEERRRSSCFLSLPTASLTSDAA